MNQEQFERFAMENAEFLHLGGSFTYGTNHDDSDRDVRGVFAAPLNVKYNPFVSFRTDMVRHDEGQDTLLWEISSFLEGLTKSPQQLEALYAPEETYLKAPSPAIKHLIKHREKFLSQNIVHSLLGHSRKYLYVARRSQMDKKPDLARPHAIHYLFFDQEMKQSLFSSRTIANSNGEGLALKRTGNSGDVTTYEMYSVDRGKMFSEDGDLMPSARKDYGGAHCQIVFFNRRLYSEHLKAYRDRMKAPDRQGFKVDLANQLGFDTKSAMNGLRTARMAKELGKTGELIVRRPDSQELRSILLEGSRGLDDIKKEILSINDELRHQSAIAAVPESLDYDGLFKLSQQVFSIQNPSPHRNPESQRIL